VIVIELLKMMGSQQHPFGPDDSTVTLIFAPHLQYRKMEDDRTISGVVRSW
jgi:hypothetical protein